MEPTIFEGFLSYSDLANSTKVRRLQLLDKQFLALDLIDQRGNIEIPTVRFFGLAEKRPDGDYQSPWLYLTNISGQTLPEEDEILSQVVVSIVDKGPHEVRVEGEWRDWNEKPYPFSGLLKKAVF